MGYFAVPAIVILLIVYFIPFIIFSVYYRLEMD